MKHIAIISAGGKMGYRLSANLRSSSYRVSHIELSEAGRLRLHELGITCRMSRDARTHQSCACTV